MDNLIVFYFSLGLQQLEIISCLAINHNIFISERTLRRKLRNLNLFRRKNFTDIFTIARFIEGNLNTHGQLHGYKWMHLKCLQNNLVVTQEVVRLLLQIIDPKGVEIRRRRRLRRRQYRNKGPNFLWHIDCYDKLKPFGICISGCIDGFSRRIMWLKAGKNSNDPKIIGGYYLQTVQELNGFPQTVRADLGTENGIVDQIQTHFREFYGNEEHYKLPPFLYGTSPANQRIEAWWSILRKHHSQFWINAFHKLKDDGLFSGTILDKALIQFCFLKIIQDELDTVAMEWNMHRISASRNSVCPRGRPFIMYHMPQVYGTTDYLCSVATEDITAYNEVCIFNNKIPCDKDVYELCVILMNENELTMGKDPYTAIDLYINLRTKLLDVL